MQFTITQKTAERHLDDTSSDDTSSDDIRPKSLYHFQLTEIVVLAYEIHIGVRSDYGRAARVMSSSCYPNNILLSPFGTTAQTILCSHGKYFFRSSLKFRIYCYVRLAVLYTGISNLHFLKMIYNNCCTFIVSFLFSLSLLQPG